MLQTPSKAFCLSANARAAVCTLQAIKAKSEAEKKKQEKKAALARPTRANSFPSRSPGVKQQQEQAQAGNDMSGIAPQLLNCSIQHFAYNIKFTALLLTASPGN